MPTHSYLVTKDLYLVTQTLSKTAAPAKPVEVPTNHFLVIDCSGSMGYDLPKVREQLKRKLPKLLKEQDTVSIIWFSGKGQFGTLLEAEPVATLADLKSVEQAIDRWLKPNGLTGFTEPLQESVKVVARVSKARPGSVASLFFMSDGCDNQGTRAGILQAMEQVSNGFASTTVVEYGYYADRALLSAMAEKAGGSHIFAEDFDRYSPAFEAVLQKKQTGAKKVEVKIEGDPIGGFVFALGTDELTTYSVDAGKVAVPEDLREISYLSPTQIGIHEGGLEGLALGTVRGASAEKSLSNAYAAISLFAVRMKPNVVYPLLASLGDASFIDQFANCFGKQKYSEFQARAQRAVSHKDERFTAGYDANRVPRDDAFTVLDVLNLLASDDNNRVLLDHPEFKYSKIGRGRIDAGEQLTAEELEEIRTLSAEMATTKKAARVTEITQRIAAITASKPAALKFVADESPDGYPISSLTFNEDRPNVSFLVRKTGTVDLTSRDSKPGTVPGQFPTFVFRNYAAIKDGLVNIDKLPVKVTSETLTKLIDEKAVTAPVGGFSTLSGELTEVVLDLRALPVINRKMVKDVSAKQFFETQHQLLVAQAEQKVYNSYSKELLPTKKSAGFEEKYGTDSATWLKDQGFTDYSGFSPKAVVAESTDFYVGKELKVSLKGYSKLPSLKEVKDQIAKKKLNGPGALMSPTVNLVESFLASDLYLKAKAAGSTATLEAWLDIQTKLAKEKVRGLIFQIAQTTFALVVGQIWFQEFSSLDENSLSLTLPTGGTIECKAELNEVQIKI